MHYKTLLPQHKRKSNSNKKTNGGDSTCWTKQGKEKQTCLPSQYVMAATPSRMLSVPKSRDLPPERTSASSACSGSLPSVPPSPPHPPGLSGPHQMLLSGDPGNPEAPGSAPLTREKGCLLRLLWRGDAACG